VIFNQRKDNGMDTSTQQQEALDLRPGSRGNGRTRPRRGRKNPDSSEEVLNVSSLKSEAPRLLRQLRKATERLREAQDDVKAVCEASGANTAQFMRLLKASLKGNYEDERRKAEQQSIIFESVGEVSDAGH
jgi:hypothetical protein